MADPLLLYYLAVLVVMILLNTLLFPRLMHQEITQVDYGTFLTMLKNKAQHKKALKLLTDNEAKLHELSKFLCEKETITGEEFMSILEKAN